MKKISVNISGHLTSLSLEDEFFDILKKLSAKKNKSVAQIIREIDATRENKNNLSSAVRIWILKEIKKYCPFIN
ncbi:MAG: ribbon-helix-helix domain-containing protein [Alphaproteobacteria bacterium]|nr:ribbon-helix-helix domain-containing protein [Alphaproteobacteria bacterium]